MPDDHVAHITGWDIGGVNIKVAVAGGGRPLRALTRPFELQRAPDALTRVLRTLAEEIGAGDVHAVTMTAELSQLFRTKRDGIGFVLDAVVQALPEARIRLFTVDGRFVSVDEARREPLAVAAANWMATALAVAAHHPDALLIDIGTTTADVVPIAAGCVVAEGRTDPERLASGELVYTGAVRTPVEAIVTHVPWAGRMTAVSAEGFAVVGDVHVWRGTLDPGEYTAPTPDGRAVTKEAAGERLARVVCGDREMLDREAIDVVAGHVADRQAAQVASAIGRVAGRAGGLGTAVVTGAGAFIAADAARRAGLEVVPLSEHLGDASRCAPAAAVALLLERYEDRPPLRPQVHVSARRREAVPVDATGPELVVKVGGALVGQPDALEAVLAALAAAHDVRLVIVPGGGPFADTVRAADTRWCLEPTASHWMAVLAMDQYAHMLASTLPGGQVVDDTAGVDAAFRAGRIPVFAPYRLLREADPLPHSWDVTSDSIAAWLAGRLGAPDLVLVKAPAATGPELLDPAFDQARPPGVHVAVVPADRWTAWLAAYRTDGRGPKDPAAPPGARPARPGFPVARGVPAP